jgi:hypothetical protein
MSIDQANTNRPRQGLSPVPTEALHAGERIDDVTVNECHRSVKRQLDIASRDAAIFNETSSFRLR